MPFDPPPVAQSLEDSSVKQFSIFLSNKTGALNNVIKLLHDHNILALALNVQVFADTAIVQLVVSDPDRVQEIFAKHEIPCTISAVLVVDLNEGASSLPQVLFALLMAEVNIHGSYPLLTRPRGNTALVIHVEDNECACSVLRSQHFRVLTQNDLSR